MIGNTTTANRTLYAWFPDTEEDIPPAVGAYASYVRDMRDENGKDTIAVHLRSRVPNPYMEDPQNLTAHLEHDSFKSEGFEASMDVEPILSKITIYDQVNYAYPFALIFDPWHVNTTTLKTLGLDLPPPWVSWGTAWWKAWNMTTFQGYLKRMRDAAWMDAPPKDNPMDEPLFVFADATVGGYGTTAKLGVQNGFATLNVYTPDFIQIYPPTGAGFVQAILLGISSRSRDPGFAFSAMMDAFIRNERFHLNAPTMMSNNRGGVSGYVSSKFSPMYKIVGKNFYNDLLDHSMFVGSPVPQSTAYGRIQSRNPMQVAFNDILYKNMSVQLALQRACLIINDRTRPPCGPYEMEAYLEDDPKTNWATLKYRWAQNETDCRHDIAGAQSLPDPIPDITPTPYISTKSLLGQLMIAISAGAMFIIMLLIVMFWWKRDTPVIRAASKVFSFLILAGGISCPL
ncbi:hypothetical protein HDV00_008035 [Rhizophlyctis rosea]|nr:hypothetical protein HDV00_008035 [Rhizophlyctis rosea]